MGPEPELGSLRLVELLTREDESVAQAFLRLDANGTGSLSIEELIEVGVEPAVADKIARSVKRGGDGRLSLAAFRTHEMDTRYHGTDDTTTVWVGNIPELHPELSAQALEAFFGARFGTVDAVKLKIRPDTDRTWCLVSFADESSAARLLSEGVSSADLLKIEYDGSVCMELKRKGTEQRLAVKPANILDHLQKPDPGQSTSSWSKVENARSAMCARTKEHRRSGKPWRRPRFMKSAAWKQLIGELWRVTIQVDNMPTIDVDSGTGCNDSVSYSQYESLYVDVSSSRHSLVCRVLDLGIFLD